MVRVKRFANQLRSNWHWFFATEIISVLAICLLAFTVRMLFSFILFPILAGPLNLGTDPDLFGILTANWVNGHGYVFHEGGELATWRGPGYPLFLAPIYAVFGSVFPAVILVHSLIGAGVSAVVYFIGKRTFGSNVGYIAAFLVAFHPILIWYTPRLRYETFLSLLIALGVLAVLRLHDSRSQRDALLVGFIFGFATLVNQVVIILPLVLLVLIPAIWKRYFTSRRLLTAVLLVMVIIIAPWTVRNYLVSGHIIPVHSGGITQYVKGNYEFEHYDEAPLRSVQLNTMGEDFVARLLGRESDDFDVKSMGVDQALLPYAIDSLRKEPLRLLAKVLTQIPRYWFLSESPLKSNVLASIQTAIAIPAILGLVIIARNRGKGVHLIAVIVYFNLIYAATHVEGRYSAPVVPLVTILAALGLRSAWLTIKEGRRFHGVFRHARS